MKERFGAARRAAALRGFAFVVVTDSHVSRAGIAGVQELLAIRHRMRIATLGEAPGDENHSSKLPSTFVAALANARSLGASSLLALLSMTQDPCYELKLLLAARWLAWPLDKPLDESTRIHQFTERDDADLFV